MDAQDLTAAAMQPDGGCARLGTDGSAKSGPRKPRGPRMSALRPSLGAFAVLTLVLVAACGSTTPSVAPSPSGVPSDAPSPVPSEVADAATWWVDSGLLPLAPETTKIQATLIETACASGQAPEGRVGDPVIFYGPDAVIVVVPVTPLEGTQDCQGNPEFPVEITLSEPLGERALLDGSSNPPRDATTTP
jgi:hypothetical protein